MHTSMGATPSSDPPCLRSTGVRMIAIIAQMLGGLGLDGPFTLKFKGIFLRKSDFPGEVWHIIDRSSFWKPGYFPKTVNVNMFVQPSF